MAKYSVNIIIVLVFASMKGYLEQPSSMIKDYNASKSFSYLFDFTTCPFNLEEPLCSAMDMVWAPQSMCEDTYGHRDLALASVTPNNIQVRPPINDGMGGKYDNDINFHVQDAYNINHGSLIKEERNNKGKGLLLLEDEVSHSNCTFDNGVGSMYNNHGVGDMYNNDNINDVDIKQEYKNNGKALLSEQDEVGTWDCTSLVPLYDGVGSIDPNKEEQIVSGELLASMEDALSCMTYDECKSFHDELFSINETDFFASIDDWIENFNCEDDNYREELCKVIECDMNYGIPRLMNHNSNNEFFAVKCNDIDNPSSSMRVNSNQNPNQNQCTYEYCFLVGFPKKKRSKRGIVKRPSWGGIVYKIRKRKQKSSNDKELKNLRLPKRRFGGIRKCSHCQATETPQWREGPLGRGTLCNACGVRYKSGKLVPEYRPAASPNFDKSLHSNYHKRIVEMKTELPTKDVIKLKSEDEIGTL